MWTWNRSLKNGQFFLQEISILKTLDEIGCMLPNCTLFLDTSSGRMENFNGKLAQYQQRDELSLMLSRTWTIEQQFK